MPCVFSIRNWDVSIDSCLPVNLIRLLSFDRPSREETDGPFGQFSPPFPSVTVQNHKDLDNCLPVCLLIALLFPELFFVPSGLYWQSWLERLVSNEVLRLEFRARWKLKRDSTGRLWANSKERSECLTWGKFQAKDYQYEPQSVSRSIEKEICRKRNVW